MPTYQYKVKDDQGRLHVGLADALNKAELKTHVREEGMYFLGCRRCDREKIFKRKARFEDLLMFTQRLTSLIEAGIPILSALKILWRQTEDETMQLVISHMRDELQSGAKISDALQDFPQIFSPMYIALISVAETGGDLVHVLRQLTAYYEYLREVIHRTKKAVFYPAIVTLFSFLVISGLFLFVVPTFGRVLGKLDADLPFLTEMILGISAWMRTAWFWLGFVTVVVGLFLLYRFLSHQWATARILDRLKLQIPYIGRVYEAISLSRFVRSFGLLLDAGVPALTALETASKTLVNRRLEEAVLEVQHEVEQGASLYEAFLHQKCFPIMLVEMIGIGESSGTLVRILERMTRHFDLEMDYRINHLLTALEPALIIVVGGVVTVTLLAIYLPIVSLWNTLMGY